MLAVIALAGCKSSNEVPTIAIDGSSTVFPITEAVAEEFHATGQARVTVGVSGTGGGFQKLCSGETAITGASRPIKPTELELCAENGIEFIELPVAYDGIAVVVHPDNTWVDQLTVQELQAMWAPEAQETVGSWSDIRPGWPDRELHLFGPGVDSGTYDYFTKAIVGTEHSSRGDFTSSEDDNVLVQGVATDVGALGFFGFAYYSENQDRIRVVPIEDGDATNGAGPIVPSLQTVGDGTYQPLSRPIFIYVSTAAAEEEATAAFIDFYLGDGVELVSEVGYIPFPASIYELVRERFSSRTTGSIFSGGSEIDVTVEELLLGDAS